MASLNAVPDTELLALMAKGKERALAELFERYWDKLLAIALNRLGNLEEAEECVQDVFLKLWNLREKLELRYSLYTYLAAATRYRVLDLLDRQYRKNLQLVSLDEHTVSSAGTHAADAALLEKELIAKIEDAIKQLPERCRVVYRLSREEHLSNKHIAARLDISEKTVEAHMTRAVKGLRDNLSTSLPAILWLLGNFHDRL